MARRWHAAAREALDDGDPLVASVLPATPEGVALFVALSSLPATLVVLAPDVRAWRTEPPVPPGTLVLLLPSLASLAPAACELGLVPILLPAPRGHSRVGGPLLPLQGPGVVVLTSGSTGLPKPVYRPMATMLVWAMGRVGALGLARGAGLLMGVSLATGQGIHNLMTAILLGGALGLLDPLDHRAALSALALPAFQCWRATSHFADVLGRCPLSGPALMPQFCLLSSPVGRSVHEAFLDRFGVPLRQTYSSTETGVVTLDDAPPDAVRPDTVGRPVPGVEIRVGDLRATPRPPGETARIWVRTPTLMTGYGFPPVVPPAATVNGWWPTQDIGAMGDDGRLVLHGRLDDCIRTREGRIVNLAMVAARLRELPGVTAAAVVPLAGPAGPSFGAVVECDPEVAVETLRAGLGESLPPWSWPRAVEAVRSLPRLPSGRPDRNACVALLGGGVVR